MTRVLVLSSVKVKFGEPKEETLVVMGRKRDANGVELNSTAQCSCGPFVLNAATSARHRLMIIHPFLFF